MNLFNISNYGWADSLNIMIAHPTKTAKEFKFDVKEASKMVVNDKLDKKDSNFLTTTNLLTEIVNLLLTNFGYEIPELESELDLNTEGIIDNENKEIEKIFGKKIFENIVKHNENIRYLINKELEQNQ